MSKKDVLLFTCYGKQGNGKSYMEHLKAKDKEIERLNNKINSIFSNFEQFINSYKNDNLDDFFIVLRLSEVIEFYNDLKEVIKNENR